MVDNIGMPISGINMSYNNTGVIGPQDADIQIKLKEGHRPTQSTSRCCARSCRSQFPGMSFAFLPADIVSQILNFGAPAPIDIQVRGPNLAANFQHANLILSKLTADPRHRRRPHPAIACLSCLQCRC